MEMAIYSVIQPKWLISDILTSDIYEIILKPFRLLLVIKVISYFEKAVVFSNQH